MKNTKSTILYSLLMIVAFMFVFAFPTVARSETLPIEKVVFNGNDLKLDNQAVIKDGVACLSLNDFKKLGFTFDNTSTKNIIYINDIHSVLSVNKKSPTKAVVYLNNKEFIPQKGIFIESKAVYIPIKQILDSLYIDVSYDKDKNTLSINNAVNVSVSNVEPIKNESITLSVKSEKYNNLPYVAKVYYKTVTTELNGIVGAPLDFKVGTATQGYKVRIEVIINNDKSKLAPISFVPKN